MAPSVILVHQVIIASENESFNCLSCKNIFIISRDCFVYCIFLITKHKGDPPVEVLPRQPFHRPLLQLFNNANHIFNIGKSILLHILLYSFRHFYGRGRIEEIGCSHGNRRGPCKKEFYCIFSRSNSAHSDDRKLHRIGHLIDHSDGNRLDRRTR